MAGVDGGAFSVLCEKIASACLVAVDLPMTNALAVLSAVFNKAADILGRIAQKKPDLVGEITAVGQTPTEMADAAGGVAAAVTVAFEQIDGFAGGKVLLQPLRTVYVYQSGAAVGAQGKNAQPLF